MVIFKNAVVALNKSSVFQLWGIGGSPVLAVCNDKKFTKNCSWLRLDNNALENLAKIPCQREIGQSKKKQASGHSF
jgi:hypothetical protein